MRETPAEDALRIAYPKGGRLALAWLAAGPLNPVQLIWMLGLKLEGEFQPTDIFWFIGLPAGLGMAAVLPVLARRETRSMASLFRLSLNTWLWISLPAILFVSLPLVGGSLQTAIAVMGIGLLTACVMGFPAALAAAWLIRLIVFRENLKPALSARSYRP
ncbi:MAG TPA: hypothetical protein PK417_15320 [Hyphomonas sp.]|nr:hypothetical protein [Hyphomonas sp.]